MCYKTCVISSRPFLDKDIRCGFFFFVSFLPSNISPSNTCDSMYAGGVKQVLSDIKSWRQRTQLAATASGYFNAFFVHFHAGSCWSASAELVCMAHSHKGKYWLNKTQKHQRTLILTWSEELRVGLKAAAAKVKYIIRKWALQRW